ncbi:MAG: UDP-N-acetylglucosamine--N-acetylmuramyl-(pentapeptide) pyrophosphoryl-undecaprenol N-acetylglucosamine transferase, partial [Clostridia bacterium]|nr:UDP-N-acetylglucosamine--N-acetylmuramyl-(pentapeptide) pyrophosphoryl-undecaprenol N-acetylglucosamine transferase [Clostridia bacterium]
LTEIEVYGLKRKLSLENIRNVSKAVSAIGKSKRLLREFSPDLVIGTGGYVSGPLVWAACDLGIPTAIHEQNAFPGLTTRRLASRVNLVMLGFADAKTRLTCKKSVLVGNPIRREILFADRAAARERLEIKESERLLVSFGGSMGSRRFNENIRELMALHCSEGRFRHIHAAGQFGIKWLPGELEERGITPERYPLIDLREYIFNMEDVMAAADLLICRAGAITLGELAAMGKPSILIPSPNVTDNHQYYNALAFAKVGAAELLEEKDCSGQVLYDRVNALLSDEEKLRSMSQAAQQFAILDSTQRIYDSIAPFLRQGTSQSV